MFLPGQQCPPRLSLTSLLKDLPLISNFNKDSLLKQDTTESLQATAYGMLEAHKQFDPNAIISTRSSTFRHSLHYIRCTQNTPLFAHLDDFIDSNDISTGGNEAWLSE